MLRFILVAVLNCAMIFSIIAHNSKIATYTLRDTGSGWFIEMNFAQAAIDAQMLKMYGEEQLAEISDEEYKKLFLDYLRGNFDFEVDGKKVNLVSGGILLGSHQTDVKFVLPEIPARPKNMSIFLPMFEEVHNQTNLFRIYRGGDRFTKFFLSADNNFSAQMEFADGDIVEVEKTESVSLGMLLGVLAALLLLASIIILLWKKLKNSELSEA